MDSMQQQALELEALAHIQRSGDLLLWPHSSEQAARMFRTLEQQGRIRRNSWDNKWQLVPEERRPAASPLLGPAFSSALASTPWCP